MVMKKEKRSQGAHRRLRQHHHRSPDTEDLHPSTIERNIDPLEMNSILGWRDLHTFVGIGHLLRGSTYFLFYAFDPISISDSDQAIVKKKSKPQSQANVSMTTLFAQILPISSKFPSGNKKMQQ